MRGGKILDLDQNWRKRSDRRTGLLSAVVRCNAATRPQPPLSSCLDAKSGSGPSRLWL